MTISRDSCVFLNRRRQEICTECGKDLTLCMCEDPDESAHLRLNSLNGRFLAAVTEVLDSSNLPYQDHLYEHLVAHIGNLGAALVSHSATRDPAPDEIYRRLVGIAALATRLATEGTPEYAYPTT